MAIITLNDFTKHGIVKDIPAHELPLNAFSDGENVAFRDGKMSRAFGSYPVFGTPELAPIYVAYVYDQFVYCGITGVFTVKDAVHYDITRTASAYTAGTSNPWTHCVVGGVAYFNNGADAPQAWLPIDETALLVDMPNWTMDYTCEALRSHKSILIAMSITDDSDNYMPQVLRWSHPAEPGAVPESWDVTDATKLAGQVVIDETGSKIIDGRTLKDSFYVYKEDQIWGLQYVGAPYVFQLRPVSRTVGVLARNCIVEANGLHFFFGRDDLYAFDGADVKSILYGKSRNWIKQHVDPTYKDRCFVTAYKTEKEVWFCYPERGAEWPSSALTYNYITGAVGHRKLNSVSSMCEV